MTAIGLLRALHARVIHWQPLVVALAALWMVFSLYYFYNLQAPQPQARYLFPALTGIAALFAVGLDHAAALVPGQCRQFAVTGLLVLLIAMNSFLVIWLPQRLTSN